MRQPRLHALRGASLIEALVALAVMGFGILGIAGIQSTLRSNGDLSKQQAEATRIAQQVIEESRSFTQLPAVVDPEVRTYEGLVSGNLGSVQGTNATFDRALVVSDLAPGRAKLLTVTVSWTDRANQPQEVRLTTNVSGVPPGLGASLSVATVGKPLRMPLGRHAGIPPEAVDQGNGTSSFSPPGAGTTRWVFSNDTGVISKICADGAEASCINAQSYLLTGFVRFATGEIKSNGDLLLSPKNPEPGVGVRLNQTAPTAGGVDCLTRTSSTYVEYFCAVPVSGDPPRWSGRSVLTGLPLAVDLTSTTGGLVRVCRYTTTRAHTAVSSSFTNFNHPLDYSDVEGTLSAQNFLVIPTGIQIPADITVPTGTTIPAGITIPPGPFPKIVPFVCPADDPRTPLINENSWHHQPAT